MANKELQKLVDAYHSGQLNRHDYRHLRRELVDRLVEQQTLAPEDEESSPATLPRHVAKGHNHPPPPVQRPRIAIIVAIVAIAALLIFGYLHFSRGMSGANRSQTTMQMSDGEQATASFPNWLENFGAAAEWKPSVVNEVLRRWRGLDTAQREKFRQTPQFHRLMDTLSRHLAEQRALAELNNGQARQQAARLQELRDAMQQ